MQTAHNTSVSAAAVSTSVGRTASGNRFATALRPDTRAVPPLRGQAFYERLVVCLYHAAETQAERWSNYHTEGVCPLAAAEITLACLARKGKHCLFPHNEAEYEALLRHALPCLRAVWRRLVWKAEQRYQSRLERGLEAKHSLDALEAAGVPIQPVDEHGRRQASGLYHPDDALAGQAGRETLDYLMAAEGLSHAQALAIVYYWAMERRSWRAAVDQVRTEGHRLAENERKRLPEIAEVARLRLCAEEGDREGAHPAGTRRLPGAVSALPTAAATAVPSASCGDGTYCYQRVTERCSGCHVSGNAVKNSATPAPNAVGCRHWNDGDSSTPALRSGQGTAGGSGAVP